MVTRRERRRHHRDRPAGDAPIPVRHRASDGPWHAGEALNIGAGGAFLIGATWPIGSAIELGVDVASRPGPLVLTGVVRWSAGEGAEDEAAGAAAAGLTGVGVQFLELDLDVIIELQAHLARVAGATGEGDDDDDIPATD